VLLRWKQARSHIVAPLHSPTHCCGNPTGYTLHSGFCCLQNGCAGWVKGSKSQHERTQRGVEQAILYPDCQLCQQHRIDRPTFAWRLLTRCSCRWCATHSLPGKRPGTKSSAARTARRWNALNSNATCERYRVSTIKSLFTISAYHFTKRNDAVDQITALAASPAGCRRPCSWILGVQDARVSKSRRRTGRWCKIWAGRERQRCREQRRRRCTSSRPQLPAGDEPWSPCARPRQERLHAGHVSDDSAIAWMRQTAVSAAACSLACSQPPQPQPTASPNSPPPLTHKPRTGRCTQTQPTKAASVQGLCRGLHPGAPLRNRGGS